MFISPYFGGCKYTNNFLFFNKNIEIQYIGLLITSHSSLPEPRLNQAGISPESFSTQK